MHLKPLDRIWIAVLIIAIVFFSGIGLRALAGL